MLEVKQFKSNVFASNTYVINSLNSNREFYLVDCGAYNEVLDYFKAPFSIKGIFITHYHYDHIVNLEEWLNKFPNLVVYGSEITKLGIASEKMNLSFYYNNPISLNIKNFKTLSDGNEIQLWENANIKFILTEGHCAGSGSFILNNYIFTGDALIPNIPTVTKLKTGDKKKALLSIDRLKCLSNKDSLICPGHNSITPVSNVKWKNYQTL